VLVNALMPRAASDYPLREVEVVADLSVTVAIPTWRRPADLKRCLEALLRQTRAPDRVFVVGRREDTHARAVAAEFQRSGLSDLAWHEVERPGHIPPIRLALERCTTDILAFLDDDAVPEPTWLDELLKPFADPSVACVGGRVVTPGHPAKPKRGAGQISWYGRYGANIGAVDASEPFEVAAVVECNMAWRSELLHSLEFDPIFEEGDSALYGLDLGLQATERGHRILYNAHSIVTHILQTRDPTISRCDLENRVQQWAHNSTYIVLKHRPWTRQVVFLGWAFLIGEGPVPGLIKAILAGPTRLRLRTFVSAARGRRQAIRTWWTTRTIMPSTGKGRPTVSVFSTRPTQFGPPFYRYVSERAAIDLTVYYTTTVVPNEPPDPELARATSWDDNTMLGYKYRDASGRRQYSALWKAIRESDLSIVEGWRHRTSLLAISIARLTRRRVAVHTDTTGLRARSRPASLLRDAVLRVLLLFPDCYFATGSAAARELERLGVSASRIFRYPYTVDVVTLRQRWEQFSRSRRLERMRLGIPEEASVILAVIKLVDREGPHDVIDAFHVLAGDYTDVWLVLVGDGPLRSEIELAATSKGNGRVLLTGYVDYDDLPRFYAIADVFVHPGRFEPWGASVHEALACGLPVIASDGVGSAEDLVVYGRTGYVYPRGDTHALHAKLAQFLTLDEDAKVAMTKAASEAAAAASLAFVECEILRALSPRRSDSGTYESHVRG